MKSGVFDIPDYQLMTTLTVDQACDLIDTFNALDAIKNDKEYPELISISQRLKQIDYSLSLNSLNELELEEIAKIPLLVLQKDERDNPVFSGISRPDFYSGGDPNIEETSQIVLGLDGQLALPLHPTERNEPQLNHDVNAGPALIDQYLLADIYTTSPVLAGIYNASPSGSRIIDLGLHSIFNHPRLNILMQQAITELGGSLTRENFEDWPSNNPFTSSHRDVLISLIRDEHFLPQGHLYILFIFK